MIFSEGDEMGTQKLSKMVFLLAVSNLVLFLAAREGAAVPSFQRQTGQDCFSCHTMFPELTPVGRAFKLTGYVINKKGESYPSLPPLAATAQISFTHTDLQQPPGSLPPDRWSLHALSSENDIVGTPQQASVFYAGQIYDKLGAFVQATYTNDNDRLAMDTADVRYANATTVCDKDLIFGVTLNNNPTVEDVWNSTPAFSFPYATANLAPTPAANPLINNVLAAEVGGAGGYLYWNNTIYAALSVYRTSLNGITSPFGVGNHPLAVYVDGGFPYWRIALTRQEGPHSFEIGTYGLSSNIYVSGDTGPADHFWDVAVDGQYQYIQGPHSFSVQTTWIHEDQDRSGSFATGAAAHTSDLLDAYRINGNYYYRTDKCGTVGGSVGFFLTTGTTDPLLYAPAPDTGSRNGSPDSNGVILELDYIPPWKCLYTKLSVQYVIYNEFNGAGSNYDGFGRNASDNNTLYLLAWLAF
jgi:hypothetical protein